MAEIVSGSAQKEINTHLNSDTSRTSSRETTPSGSEASGELENENEDDFRGQQYDPIGPVDETTESRRLRLLATSGVQTEERSMGPTTHLQPLQGDQPARHPLSNQPLSNSTSTALSSATQNPQLADHSTSVVTGARADRNVQFGSACKSTRALKTRAAVSDVLGRASSPEPAELSPFKPKPSQALTRACSGLRLGFRFQKPEPEAQARALIHCGSMQTYNQQGNIKNINV